MDTGSFSENLSSRLSPDQNCSNTEPSSTLKGLIRSPCGGSKKTAPYSFLCPCSWWRGVCLPLRPPPHPPHPPLLATPTLKLKSASAQKPVTATEALFRNRGQKYSFCILRLLPEILTVQYLPSHFTHLHFFSPTSPSNMKTMCHQKWINFAFTCDLINFYGKVKDLVKVLTGNRNGPKFG